MGARTKSHAVVLALLLAGALPSGVAASDTPPAKAEAALRGKLPSQLPVRRDSTSAANGTMWSPILALVTVAVAVGGLWLWRTRASRASRARPVRRQDGSVVRLSSQALTQQASVHVIHWHGEEYLLGCTPQQVTLLSRRVSPAAPGGEP